MFFYRSTVLLCLLSLVCPIIAEAGDESGSTKLILKLNNLRNRSGSLCVSIFPSEEGFPNDAEKASFYKCLSTQELSDSSTLTVEVPSLGQYAVAFFHDENNDRQLNTGAFGIPLEGFAFSNNPKIRFSAPKFSECAFQIADHTQLISIDLRYFL